MRVIKMIVLCSILLLVQGHALAVTCPAGSGPNELNTGCTGIEEEKAEVDRLKAYYRGVASAGQPVSQNPMPLAVGAAEAYQNALSIPKQQKDAYVDERNQYIYEANRELNRDGETGKCYKKQGTGPAQEIPCIHDNLTQGGSAYAGSRYDRDVKPGRGDTGEKTWRDDGDNPQNRPVVSP